MQPRSIYHVANSNNTLRGGATNYRSCMMRSAKSELHRNKTPQMQTWRTTTKQKQCSSNIRFTKPELRGMKKTASLSMEKDTTKLWRLLTEITQRSDRQSLSHRTSTWHKRDPQTVSPTCTPQRKNKACQRRNKTALGKYTCWRMQDWCHPEGWTRSRNQNVENQESTRTRRSHKRHDRPPGVISQESHSGSFWQAPFQLCGKRPQ